MRVTAFLAICAFQSSFGSLIFPPQVDGVFGDEVLVHYKVHNNVERKILEICVSITATDSGELVLSDACIEVTPAPNHEMNVLKISSLEEGVYELNIGCDGAKAQSILEVHAKREIVPTYDWQALRIWHSIPLGVETRLPLSDGGGSKEVRIPDPFKVQIVYPEPCKYFFRMDVYRSTTIQQIIDQAALGCNISSDCLSLSTAVGPLDDVKQTVESTDLFNLPKLSLEKRPCGDSLT